MYTIINHLSSEKLLLNYTKLKFVKMDLCPKIVLFNNKNIMILVLYNNKKKIFYFCFLF